MIYEKNDDCLSIAYLAGSCRNLAAKGKKKLKSFNHLYSIVLNLKELDKKYNVYPLGLMFSVMLLVLILI
ncbi:hypothetical protein [uncultured Methanobrevibacter sp.]|uniref:hypothetical protein n=1 Tax=uncultured Methanobrevibacter sp. TaxID=253161 RepID=UPI002631814C